MSDAGVRARVASASRVVVKVGSSSLTLPGGGLAVDRIAELVGHLAARHARGHQVVLVSSGAIATGFPVLGLSRRPRDLATQQASASVGQGMLLAHYTSAFARYGLTVGQVLVTADDVIRRSHYRVRANHGNDHNSRRAQLVHLRVVARSVEKRRCNLQ